MTHKTTTLILGVALLGVHACGSSDDDDSTTPPVGSGPEAPLVEILQPVPTGAYKVGQDIPLKAQVSDSDSDLSEIRLVWTSSLDGVVSDGYPDDDGEYNDVITLDSAGTHQLLVEAEDPDGEEDSASISITIDDLQPPRVTLNNAPSGLQEGDSATITGTVSDAEDDPTDLFVLWRVDDVTAAGSQPNAAGQITLITDPLGSGVHQVSVTVTDSDGASTVARVDVQVATCPDLDRDGYASCGGPGDDIDCDDRDAAINPGADEVCGDGEDQDCDDDVDEGFPDQDNDDIPDCVDECPKDRFNDRDDDGVCGDVDNCPTKANPDQLDADMDDIGDACDDEVSELCDGIDNDGDTRIDEDFNVDSDSDGQIDCMDSCPHDALDDGDGDGYCADEDNCPTTTNPGQEDTDGDGVGDLCDVELCDGVDNDRDGNIDEDFDQDGDGYPTCALAGTPADCDDNDANAYPGPAEVCGDGKDNNCDGFTDLTPDMYEPNDSIGNAYDLGFRDDETFDLYPTIFRADGIDSDFFEMTVDDDACCGPDTFVFHVELSQVPAGLNLQLKLHFGSETLSATVDNGVQTIIRHGTTGPDDSEYPYIIEVKNVGGTTLEACQPYHLWVNNQD